MLITLRHSSIPLSNSLLVPHHLTILTYLYVCVSRKEEEWVPKINRNRGIGKTERKFPPLMLEEKMSQRLSSMFLFPLLLAILFLPLPSQLLKWNTFTIRSLNCLAMSVVFRCKLAK